MPDDDRVVDLTVAEVLEQTSDLATQLKDSIEDLKLLLADYAGSAGA